MVILADCAKIAGMFQPWTLLLARGDVSPKLGARNDVPHVPRMVRPASSEMFQLTATFGLLVPATSLYWSWRQEPSKSRRLMPGSAFASPMIGTFTCVNTAQTWRCCGSNRMGAMRFGAAVKSMVRLRNVELV